MKIKYDSNLMHYMNAFTTVTGAGLKDCFVDDNKILNFIVNENELGKAIGKKGFKVRLIERAVNRKIKILEFNSDVLRFVKNVIYPLKVSNIEMQENIILMEAIDSRTRGLLIGRAAINLRGYESIVKRYYDIEELKVQ